MKKSILIIFIVFILYFLSCWKFASFFEQNFSGFACVGDKFQPTQIVDNNIYILKNCMGYDGQFFYFICFDPFIKSNIYKYLDVPAYRYQRILYPLLAKIIALNNKTYFKYSLILVNIFSVIIGTYFIILLLKQYNLNLWFALCYGLISGFLICTFRDLCEPLATLFMTISIYCYLSKKPICYCASLAMMLLTKEIYLLLIPFFIFDSLFLNKRKNFLLGSILSFIPLVGWEYYIYSKLNIFAFTGGTKNFDIPFNGIIQLGTKFLNNSGYVSEKIFFIITVFILVSALIISIIQIFEKVHALSMSLLFFSIYPIFLSNKVWIDPWSYGRVLLPLYVLILINFILTKKRIFFIPMIAQLFLFVTINFWQKIVSF